MATIGYEWAITISNVRKLAVIFPTPLPRGAFNRCNNWR
nr:MAG TPA: hypothetical protein [Caudoviricetes sp.]